MVVKPNWKDIKRCPIWKVLGITECNDCDTLLICWPDSDLPIQNNDEQLLNYLKQQNKDGNNI